MRLHALKTLGLLSVLLNFFPSACLAQSNSADQNPLLYYGYCTNAVMIGASLKPELTGGVMGVTDIFEVPSQGRTAQEVGLDTNVEYQNHIGRKDNPGCVIHTSRSAVAASRDGLKYYRSLYPGGMVLDPFKPVGIRRSLVTRDNSSQALAGENKNQSGQQFGFCYITIYQSDGRPEDRGKLDNSYFSDLFRVATSKLSAGANTAAFLDGLQKLMIRQIAETYNDADPRMNRSCRFFKSSGEAEQARRLKQESEKRARAGARIIETHFLLGQQPA